MVGSGLCTTADQVSRGFHGIGIGAAEGTGTLAALLLRLFADSLPDSKTSLTEK